MWRSSPRLLQAASRSQRPSGYWSSKEHRREFMEKVASELNVDVKQPSAWKDVTAQEVAKLGGRGFLKRYSFSLYDAITDTFPEYGKVDLADVRRKMPRNHWKERSNRKQLLDDIAVQLGVSSPSDWRNVNPKDVTGIPGGHSLLMYYKNSLMAALDDLYGSRDTGDNEENSSHDILAVRTRVPRNYWDKAENVREFMETVRNAYGVTQKEDWYRVSAKQIEDMQGSGLLRKYETMATLLRIAYPTETWDDGLVRARTKRSRQKQLAQSLGLLLNEELPRQAV